MQFRFGDCVVDVGLFELRRAGEPIPVQPKVLSLLIYLLENRDRTVTKDEILDAVWPDTATGEGSLTRAVRFARVAIGDEARDGDLIRTVRGRGYRIGIPVEVDSGETEPAGKEDPPSDFLCRDRELRLAKDALAKALEGRGRVLLLVGEPGMGKTRLAEELGSVAAQRGAEVLWGRCEEGAGSPPFWPWAQILRAHLRRHGDDVLPETLGPMGAATVATIVPEVRHHLPELPVIREPEPKRAQFQLFDAMTSLLRRSSERRPLVLILDDLHAADEASLMLLRFLGRELARERILVVGTYRDVEVQPRHPLNLAIDGLSRAQPPRQTILMRGLTHRCVARFIERIAGVEASVDLVDAVFAKTDGNPLFLVELLSWLRVHEDPPEGASDAWEREIPEGLRQAIDGRLATLSDVCRETLVAASVIGRNFPLWLLSEACAAAEEEVLVRLEEAERARVVERTATSPVAFRFSHSLVAESLYDGLATAQRVRIHGRVAEALEGRYRPRPVASTDLDVGIRPDHLAELAHHFAESAVGAGVDKAIDYGTRAGDHAMQTLAYEEAARRYERALRILEASAPADDPRIARLQEAATSARAHSPSG